MRTRLSVFPHADSGSRGPLFTLIDAVDKALASTGPINVGALQDPLSAASPGLSSSETGRRPNPEPAVWKRRIGDGIAGGG
jgi:hypothetical protein